MGSTSSILFLALGLALTACKNESSRFLAEANAAGILHRGNGSEPDSLDPHLATSVSAGNVILSLYEGLVRADPKTLQPIPAVATRWDVSDDQLRYTFYLREDAKWSNGDAMTAEDFVFSWTRMLAPELAASYAYMLYPLKGAKALHEGTGTLEVRALDAHTLEVNLEAPVPHLLTLMTHWTWMPVHRATLEAHGSVTDRNSRWCLPGNLVSNGPFRLKEWVLQQKIVLEKCPNYWGAAEVQLNQAVFHVFPDAGAETRAFLTGKLHTTYKLPAEKVPGYKETHADVLRIDPYLESVFYVCNFARPPLDNPKVRQALSLAIDRELISTQVLKGLKQPAFSFVPPGTAGFVPQKQLEQNVERAKALLAEAGFPNGEGFPTLTLMFPSSPEVSKVAQVVQQQWVQKLGVKIELNNVERKTYFTRRRAREFDLCYFGWVGDYLDPDTFLGMWKQGAGNNVAGYASDVYDSALAEAAKLPTAERLQKQAEAEAQLLTDLPILPLYFGATCYLVHPSVQGWYPTLLDQHPLQAVWLEPAE